MPLTLCQPTWWPPRTLETPLLAEFFSAVSAATEPSKGSGSVSGTDHWIPQVSISGRQQVIGGTGIALASTSLQQVRSTLFASFAAVPLWPGAHGSPLAWRPRIGPISSLR